MADKGLPSYANVNADPSVYLDAPPAYTESSPNVQVTPSTNTGSSTNATPSADTVRVPASTNATLSAETVLPTRVAASASTSPSTTNTLPASTAVSSNIATPPKPAASRNAASSASSASFTTATASTNTRSTYIGPSAYHIGDATLHAPLVELDHLRAHLALLRAFKALRTLIEDADELGLQALRMDSTARWAWFVGLAVERFQRWTAVVRKGDLLTWVAAELPPIDVLMVWHAYLLNPGWYAEDCLRLPIMETLRTLGDRFIHAVFEMGDPEQYQPSPERVASWQEQTGTPWDALDAAVQMTHQRVECPRCCMFNEAPYLTLSGTGYAQHKFAHYCMRCGFEVTRETLAVRRFVRDLTKPYLDSQDSDSRYGAYLAGTLHTETKAKNTSRGEAIRGILMRSRWFRKWDGFVSSNDWEEGLLKKLQYSLSAARAAADDAMQPNGGSLCRRIFSAYTDDRPFSIDLVGAVVRQGAFIDKMHEFGWTKPGYFDSGEDELVLVHATARYHAFLDLMNTSPSLSLLPTLDIDLVWHSHQLMGSRYEKDCMQYVRRYVDHDDTVKENKLAMSLETTCRAWQGRFNIPYMYCGCPLPGESVGQRLTRLSQNLFHKNDSDASAILSPPRRADAFSATHASEHNSVVPSRGAHAAAAEQQRHGRAERFTRRQRRDAERALAGRIDVDVFELGRTHDAAFLTPMPFYRPVAACVVVANPIDTEKLGIYPGELVFSEHGGG
ncbi:hypothetical protein SCP_1602460 [Sparassis crispa]|uniref:Uncharacterized protein n=1 Tax=Sparassis crispa TaxID=139825 RepID=A0A401H5B4_9APHY|nr:hypothetical protein SCP_1602460 [Sparassis crispa]GBE89583.1 hypothetical protein SCP_1602460 [Sparassis crispa]